MVAGHFGLAAGVKAQVPGAPLWVLMLASQWLDVFFVPLYLAGLETIDPVDPANPNVYGGGVIHAVYTHSLLGAVLLSVLAGVLAWQLWGRRIGLVITAVAFSHWLLDLLVHRADLPILPANAGNLPQLGFGLWQVPIVAALLELLLVLGGQRGVDQVLRDLVERDDRPLAAVGVVELPQELALAVEDLSGLEAGVVADLAQARQVAGDHGVTSRGSLEHDEYAQQSETDQGHEQT